MAPRLIIHHSPPDVVISFQRDSQSSPEITTSPAPFESPLTAHDLEELRWYLEDYLYAPVSVYGQRARTVERHLEQWGELLFKAVFPVGSQARDVYEVARGGQQAELWIRSKSSAFLGLPWELCLDPQQNASLVSTFCGLTRSLDVSRKSAELSSLTPLRILMIISRPEGTPDVRFQLVAWPLVDMIRHIRRSVQVDVLRPPTIDALRLWVERANREGHPYQVIHFDGHGVFSNAGPTPQQDLESHAQLVFETARGLPYPVSAHDLIQQMGGTAVPLFVLNACHSGTIVEGIAPEAAIATRLLQEGAASVVAMSYALFSDAAAWFVSSFYQRLLQGDVISRAVEAGRTALRQNPARRTPAGHIGLQDWVVPVHYANRSFSFPQITSASGEPAALKADHPFVGRDPDIHALERRLRQHRVLLIHGMAGVGKTELAHRFSRWFSETGGFNGISAIYTVSFGTAGRPRLLRDVLNELGTAANMEVSASHNYTTTEQITEILNWLTRHPVVCLFDGLEVVNSLPCVAGVESPWPDADLEAFREILHRADGTGGGVILMTSRSNELWLGEIQRHELRGLDELAVAELEDAFGAATRPREPAEEENDRSCLLASVDGHPECLRILFSHPAHPASIEMLSRAEGGVAVRRLEWAFQALSSMDRSRLLALALSNGFVDLQLLKFFTGFFDKDDEERHKWRQELPARFGDMDFELWEGTLDACTTAGLASKRDTFIYQLHPALPTFLMESWRRQAGGKFDAELSLFSATYRRAVVGLAFQLSMKIPVGTRLAPEGPPSGMRSFGLEYLKAQVRGHYSEVVRAFLSALQDNELTLAGMATGFLTVAWDVMQDKRELQRVCALVSSTLDARQGSEPVMDGVEGTLRLFAIINRAVDLDYGRSDLAMEEECRRMLKVVEGRTDDHGLARRAELCWALGILLDKEGRLDEAFEWLSNALSAYQDLGEQGAVKRAKHSLAIVTERKGLKYTAREISAELLSDGAITPTELIEQTNRLAIEAFEGGEYGKASAIQLRNLAVTDDDPAKRARAMHELGLIAAARGDLDDAERWLRSALAIKSKLPDDFSTGNTISELGHLAFQRERFEEAESWYREALTLIAKGDSPTRLAGVHVRLAELAERRGDYPEALNSLIRAIVLLPELYGPAAAPAFMLIGRIVTSQGVAAFEARWKELNGALPPFNVLVELGEILQQTEHLEEAIQIARQIIQATESGTSTQSPERASALLLLTRCRALQGNLAEVLPVIEESVAIYRRLAQDNPKKFSADLAESLRGLAALTAASDRVEAAVGIIEESISIHRSYLVQPPGVSHTLLAHALQLLAKFKRKLGQIEGALAAEEEQVTILRACAKVDRAYRKPLMEALFDMAESAIFLKREAQALGAITEFRDLKRLENTEKEQASALPPLADIVRIHAQCLKGVGRLDEAIDVYQESIDLLAREVATSGSAAAQYAFILVSFAADLHIAGRPEPMRTTLDKFAGLITRGLLTAEGLDSMVEAAVQLALDLKKAGHRAEAQLIFSALSQLASQHPQALPVKTARAVVHFDLTLGSREHLDTPQLEKLCEELRELPDGVIVGGLYPRRGFALATLVARYCEENDLPRAMAIHHELEEVEVAHSDDQVIIFLFSQSLANLASLASSLGEWDAAAAYHQLLVNIVRRNGNDAQLLSLFDEISTRLLSTYAEKQKPELARDAIDAIVTLVDGHPDPPGIFRALFHATNNFLIRYRPDGSLATHLYEKLSSLVAAYPAEESLRLCFGMCCMRYIEANVANNHLTAAAQAFDRLAELAKSEDAFGMLLIWAAGPLVHRHLQAGKLDAAKLTYGKLMQLVPGAIEGPEMPAMLARLFYEVFSACMNIKDLHSAREAYRHFSPIARQHLDDRTLAEIFAISCANLLGASAEESAFRQFYEDLVAVTEAQAADLNFRRLRVIGSVNAIAGISVQGGRPDLGRKIFDQLIELLQAHLADPTIIQSLPMAALNLIIGYVRRGEYVAAQHTLSETLQFISTLPLEAAQIDPLRDGAVQIIEGYLGSRDQKGAVAVLRLAPGLFQDREAFKSLASKIGAEAANHLFTDAGMPFHKKESALSRLRRLFS